MEKDFEEEQKKQKRKAWLSFAKLIGLMIVLLVAAAFVNRYLFYVVIAIYALMVIYAAVQAGTNYVGPLKVLATTVIRRQYKPEKRKGEIVFYGASNFTYWSTMEQDIPGFKVQNHGFGGSDDAGLMKYAEKLLYPYDPKIVVFQTGSNDYVHVDGSDEEKIAFCMKRKKEMFETFHKRLPKAKFLVLAGILLPGRSQYLELTKEINRQLRELCESNDYMTYVDAEDMTYQNGSFDKSLFQEDKIHLTPEARVRWAEEYIIPALETAVAGLGAEGESLRKEAAPETEQEKKA